ncbi:MAG TPA: DUF4142 domain-containing protein [Stellaceae bacterium]|nr:DUF4142 domain-containing protein [Stellaceae bacterium]
MSHRFAQGASAAIMILASTAAFGQTRSQMTPGDQQFIKEAAIGGQFEVDAGKLAAQSANPQVKQFGEKMVQDHGTADAQLKNIVQAQGATAPAGLDPKHAQLRNRLASLKGEAFDREYITQMVKDHDEDAKKFADEQRNTKDPQLKQFAEQTLTVIKEHDQMARQIAGTMGIKVSARDKRG